MKILSLGASTSSTSINRKFANHTAHQIPNAQITELNLREFNLPIFSEDLEKETGEHPEAQRFLDIIRDHDAIILSMAEHNGAYTAAFKNLYDWTSRIDQKLWSNKPMLLLATSPGQGGGQHVLAAAKATFPRMGADLKATFSLPSFYENFNAEKGIIHPDLAKNHQQALASLTA